MKKPLTVQILEKLKTLSNSVQNLISHSQREVSAYNSNGKGILLSVVLKNASQKAMINVKGVTNGLEMIDTCLALYRKTSNSWDWQVLKQLHEGMDITNIITQKVDSDRDRFLIHINIQNYSILQFNLVCDQNANASLKATNEAMPT